MKVGIHYWNFSTPADPAQIAPTLSDSARIAEQAGIDSYTVMDHYFQMRRMGRPRSRCSRATPPWAIWPRPPRR